MYILGIYEQISMQKTTIFKNQAMQKQQEGNMICANEMKKQAWPISKISGDIAPRQLPQTEE